MIGGHTMWFFTLMLACAVSEPVPSTPEVHPVVDRSPPESRELEWARALAGQAEVVFDVTEPDTGWIGVTARYEGIPYGPKAVFRKVSQGEEHAFRQVRFQDGEGRAVAHVREGNYWRVESPPPTLVMTYEVRPGGLGRHGHQGYVASDWAAFDGRVLLLPRGGHGLADVRVQYRVPDTWEVHTPFRPEEGGWWNLDTTGPGLALETLQTSCVALGVFEEETLQLGETELRVVAHASFDPVWRGDVLKKTLQLAEWYHQELAWDLRQPFLLAWLPKPSESGVFGGAWSTGACYEHPVESSRNWELLGHRFAHPVNKYNPTGMKLADARDRWFMEGWASYIEIVGASANGLGMPDEQGFTPMWRRYNQQRLHHPGLDRPLAEEPEAKGEATEFLHYLKGPLVVKLLADTLDAQAGKSLEAFHAEMYGKYGRLQSPFPLRQELEAFSGVDLSEFWLRYVDQTGVVVPTWSGYAVHQQGASAAAQRAPMAAVGALRVQDDVLFYLAWSGQFESYAAIEAFLADAASARATLDARGVRLWPAWMYGVEFGLEPGVRLAIWHAEQAFVYREARAANTSGGCAGQEGVAAPEFTLNPSHPASSIWGELRAIDDAYIAQRMRVGLEAFSLSSPIQRNKGPLAERLALLDHETVAMVTRWLSPPPYVGFRVVGESGPGDSRRNPVEPTWSRTWLELKPEERSSGEHLLRLQLEHEDQVLVERAFWQRSRPD